MDATLITLKNFFKFWEVSVKEHIPPKVPKVVLQWFKTFPHTNEVVTMFPKLFPYDFSVFQKFLFLIVPRSINEKNPFENIKSSWEQLWDVITIDDWSVPGKSQKVREFPYFAKFCFLSMFLTSCAMAILQYYLNHCDPHMLQLTV